ncbi:subtilisin inhibitor-like [Nonomuraea polychroma]|uniref:Subtilisin inhibitor-like n=1 Tax=Nonomuraea polychroma TaxID=46176 RepID=A0A438MBV6_9ACTN|nr:SSI family serine proteinase inhibitor [Nonomuraea polychroma]RVX43135.1 subtilisin inhibitor-like [Nonomuraea polychroma]
MMRTIGTIALCAAFLASSSPAAQAARPPKGKLKIAIAVKDGPTRGGTLHCGPDGGTHPHPRAACDVVRKVGGDFNKIHVPADETCGEEVKPYAVVITGTWRGKKVQWSKGYRNFCVMQAAGGKLLS